MTDEREKTQDRSESSKRDSLSRFWARVKKTDDCWIWTGHIHEKSGYGRFGHKGVLVHRYSFFLHNGFYPEPCCLHSCDNRTCVNPDHLRQGTCQDNMDDAVSRNRMCKGEELPFAKLDNQKVRDIRLKKQEGVPVKILAQEYHVDLKTIRLVIHRRTWRHVV